MIRRHAYALGYTTAVAALTAVYLLAYNLGAL